MLEMRVLEFPGMAEIDSPIERCLEILLTLQMKVPMDL